MRSIFIFFCFFSPLFSLPPTIVLNTIPKSGSVYIWQSLEKTLKPFQYEYRNIANHSFYEDAFNLELIQHLQSKRRVYFTRQHLLPTAHNVRIFHDYFPKFILHLRDPRQVLISWTHFIEKFGQENFKYISSDLHPPASYFSLPLEKKFDWQIAHFLPVVVQWMQAWTRVIDKNEFNILVTRYEDFVQDPERFIRKIAGFYDLKPPHVFLPEKNPKSYFRKGEKDEWKKMLSPRQIQRIHQIIPKSLLRRYNWES